MKKATLLSAIVPCYNGLELLQKNLDSLLAALDDKDELILIDDASTDGTSSWLINEFKLIFDTFTANDFHMPAGYSPNFSQIRGNLYRGTYQDKDKKVFIQLFVNETNKRFGESVNTGVLFAQNPLLFLCNTDVLPTEDCFSYVRPLFADPKVFAVGCMEYEHSQLGQMSGKNKLWFHRGLFQHAKATDFSSGDTAWASGGSAVFSKEKWLELLGFDDAYYPAYWEDLDLSFRARKKGWKVLFEKKAVVYHKHESTNSSVFRKKELNDISWRNSLIFTWKNSTNSQKASFLLWLPYWMVRKWQA